MTSFELYFSYFYADAPNAKVILSMNVFLFIGDKESSVKETRRNRSDPSAAILEQLISPLHDLGSARPRHPQPAAPTPLDKDTEAINGDVSDSAVDIKVNQSY